jgi:hypothetical protein
MLYYESFESVFIKAIINYLTRDFIPCKVQYTGLEIMFVPSTAKTVIVREKQTSYSGST